MFDHFPQQALKHSGYITYVEPILPTEMSIDELFRGIDSTLTWIRLKDKQPEDVSQSVSMTQKRIKVQGPFLSKKHAEYALNNKLRTELPLYIAPGVKANIEHEYEAQVGKMKDLNLHLAAADIAKTSRRGAGLIFDFDEEGYVAYIGNTYDSPVIVATTQNLEGEKLYCPVFVPNWKDYIRRVK